MPPPLTGHQARIGTVRSWKPTIVPVVVACSGIVGLEVTLRGIGERNMGSSGGSTPNQRRSGAACEYARNIARTCRFRPDGWCRWGSY
jgi:hypothetical protein